MREDFLRSYCKGNLLFRQREDGRYKILKCHSRTKASAWLSSWDIENSRGNQKCEIYHAQQENFSLKIVTNLTQKWAFVPLVLIV